MLVLLRYRETLVHLLSFEMFVINTSKLSRSDFSDFNVFINISIDIIDRLTKISREVSEFIGSWLSSSTSAQPPAYGQSASQKWKNLKIDSCFSQDELLKYIQTTDSKKREVFDQKIELWLQKIDFELISNPCYVFLTHVILILMLYILEKEQRKC